MVYLQKKKRILFCIETLTSGGAEKLLITLLKRIDYDLYDVDLCILLKKGVYFGDLPTTVKYFFYADAIHFEHMKYDIEIAFLEGNSTKIVGQRMSNAFKIAWVHTDLLNNHWTWFIYKSHTTESIYYNMMDQIIFVSEISKLQFEKLFPNVTTPKSVIYNMFDVQSILSNSEIDVPMKEKFTLCSIGRLIPLKGYERLMPILSELKKNGYDFHFWLIGEGVLKDNLTKLIHQYELHDVVFLKGYQKNPYSWLKASDIFVLPSFAEGYPLVIGEALCLGKPILATNVTGITELLGDSKYGMIVNTDDNSLYEGLKRMISDESLRNHYALKARSRLNAIFCKEKKILSQINQLFHHTLSPKQPIDHLAHRLINNTNNNPGLLYGKMGEAIFFFHYSIYSKNRIYEDYAIELIDDIQSMISNDTSSCYESGLAGIGSGIEYLIQNNLVEGDADDILEHIDNLLYKSVFDKNIPDFTHLKGYMGYARYWMHRLHGKKNSRGIDIAQNALKHVLSIIESHYTDINSDKEKIDILRFLLDLRSLCVFSDQVDKIINRHYDVDFNHVDFSLFFDYLKDNQNNMEIKKMLLNRYFPSYDNHPLKKISVDIDTEPCLLNGAISSGLLYMLSHSEQPFPWIELF